MIEFETQIREIIAAAPDHIGAVMIWPASDGQGLWVGLADHRTSPIIGTSLVSEKGIFNALESAKKVAEKIQTHMSEVDSEKLIAEHYDERQIADGLAAMEGI